ncbi:MAG: hypothetical protein WCJ01_05830 [Ignavibacteria bacterium]
MELETINALVNDRQVQTVKDIIDALSDKIPNLVVTQFKYGRIGDDILVSFKIDKDRYKLLVEKLTFNQIRLVTLDEKTKEYVGVALSQAKAGGAGGMMSRGNKPKPKQEEKKTLEQFINEGEYNEVIRISRDVTLPKEEIEKAKSNIDSTIQRAINTSFSEAQTKKFDINRNLERLIHIATDNNLKVLNKIEYIKQAGLYAIDICGSNHDYVSDLINLCNNNTLHSLISVKAAVKFYDVVFADMKSYKKEILIARRNLNTRWLSIAVSSVEADLSAHEKKSFYALIDFISANRV